ncbi:TPA: host cell division inhibitor Icd-like protein [Escherichia coli]|nr:host cell division inhibitor Icd-like protein [Escherichia coli]
MACIQHTQTRPKYQYRFLALSAIGRNVIHITATTEREARRTLAQDHVCFFAGRIRLEVAA